MDAGDVAWLRSAEGQRAVAAAAAQLPVRARAASQAEALARLGAEFGPQRARAAAELVAGRRAAAAKFAAAERLFFDRESAEQASAEAVARWTAARFAGRRRIADLGCGAGGDALALAAHAEVVAVDRDPGRLALLAANAEVPGLAGRIEAVAADLEGWSPPAGIEAVWLDPSRRDAAGRRLEPARWSPPLARAIELASRFRGAGIKLAPGIALSALPADAEVEFVSLEGRLVEAVLWLGELAGPPRRASLVPAGASLAGDPGALEPAPVEEPGAYLYDPDPAVGRAGLVAALAADLQAWQLDRRLAYLSSGRAAHSPFARRFRVLTWLPFSERRLARALVGAGSGGVEVMRRGSPIDTNALERRLNARLGGGGPVHTVALTRLRGQSIAIVCVRERAA